MSDKRWLPVESYQTDGSITLGEAYDAAEGQRVEMIRWCETHGESAWGEAHYCRQVAFAMGQPDCNIVDATLILPPRSS